MIRNENETNHMTNPYNPESLLMGIFSGFLQCLCVILKHDSCGEVNLCFQRID